MFQCLCVYVFISILEYIDVYEYQFIQVYYYSSIDGKRIKGLYMDLIVNGYEFY